MIRTLMTTLAGIVFVASPALLNGAGEQEQRDRELEARERHEQRMMEERRHHEQRLLEEAFERLSHIDRESAEELRRFCMEDPRECEHVLDEILPWLEELDEMRREDLRMYELEVRRFRLEKECDRIADHAREAEDKERDRIKVVLREKLNELFEVSMEMRELEIKRLEEELRELKTGLNKMRENKVKMIEHRLTSHFIEDEEW